jgi:hypothetical protein
MTHTRFVAQFGRGKQSVRVANRHLQGVDRQTASIYLRTAFEQWSPVTSGSHTEGAFHPLLLDGKPITEAQIELICDALFSKGSLEGAREMVYCRPSPGLSPLAYYRRAAARKQSVVVVSPQQPVILGDVGQDLRAWEELLESLIGTPDDQTTGLLHIWAIKEPRVSRSASSLRALASIAILEMLFKLEIALQASGDAAQKFWQRLNRSAVLAIKENNDNDRSREEPARSTSAGGGDLDRETRIAESDVFPTSSRAEWVIEGKAPELGSVHLVCVGEGRSPTYGVLTDLTANSRDGPLYAVSDVPSPGADIDRSFHNLLMACTEYQARTRNEAAPAPHLEYARISGWRFFLPQQFVSVSFPLAT